MSVLDYIERIKQENEGPRITAQKPRTMVADASTEMEQSPDSFLRGAYTDWTTNPPRIVPPEQLEDWDISFRKPNAEGGVQQLVRNTADGSRPGYNGPGPVSVETIAPNIQELTYGSGSKSYKGLIQRGGKIYSFSDKKLNVVKDFIKDKEKTEKSLEGTGRKRIGTTSRLDNIAKKYYGVDTFDDLGDSLRSQIRSGKVNPKNSNYYIKKTGADEVKNFIEKFKKKEGRLPSKTEVRHLFKKHNRTLNSYINEGFLKDADFLSIEDANIIGQRKKVFSDVQKLAKDNIITKAFQRGKINNDVIKRVMKLVGVDEVLAHDRLAQLANAYMGVDEVPLVSPKFKKQAKDILMNQIPASKSNLKRFFGKQISSSVGEKRNIIDISSDIQDVLRRKGISQIYDIDEPAGRTSSVRKGTKPYAYFSQVIFGNVNKADKHTFDAVKAIKEDTLQKALAEGKGVKQALGSLNRSVKKYEEKLNQGIKRGGKKIRLFKASLKHPSETIARFDELPASAQKGFTDNFITKGYSFHVPKDIKTISELNADIQNPKSNFFKKMISASDEVKKYLNEYDETKLFNKVKKLLPEDFRKLIKKLPLRIAQGNDITEKRFASADNIMTSGVQYVDDVEEGNFITRNPYTTAGAGVAATATTPKGRKFLGRAFNLGLGPMGMAGLTYGLKPEGGYDLSRAGDRIGFEAEAALAPTLVKGAQSVTEKIKNPLLRKGLEYASGIRLPGISPANILRAARIASPIGLLSLAGEGIYHAGKKEMAKRAQMSPEELDAYMFEKQSRGWSRMKKAGGGMVGIRKPHAIPPERQGLRSIMINGKKS